MEYSGIQIQIKVSDKVKYENPGMTNLKGDHYEQSTKG